MTNPTIRVAVIGLDHPHVFGIAHALASAGAEIAAFHQPGGGGLAGVFASAYADAKAIRLACTSNYHTFLIDALG